MLSNNDKSLISLRIFEIKEIKNNERNICYRLNNQCFNLKILYKHGIFNHSSLLNQGFTHVWTCVFLFILKLKKKNRNIFYRNKFKQCEII